MQHGEGPCDSLHIGTDQRSVGSPIKTAFLEKAETSIGQLSSVGSVPQTSDTDLGTAVSALRQS